MILRVTFDRAFVTLALAFMLAAGLQAQTTLTSTPGTPVDFGGASATPRTIADTINVSGATGATDSVLVGFRVDHAYMQDIVVFLVPPGVTWNAPYNFPVPAGVVELSIFSGPAGAGSFGTGTAPFVYAEVSLTTDPVSPATAGSIVGGASPFTAGVYEVSDAADFDAIYGTDPNGDWKLVLYDDDPSLDDGTFFSWQLTYRTTALPEIDMQRPAGTIFSIPSGGNAYIGSIPDGVTSSATWTVANRGGGQLDVTAVSFGSVTGAIGTPTLTTGMPLNIAAISSATFSVDITPTGLGVFGFQMTITNNDSDEGTYVVNVTGEVDQFFSGPGVAIPDSADGISDTINVSGATGNITSMHVGITLFHTWDEDLNIYLLPPGVTWTGAINAGTVPGGAINLSTQNGVSGDNYTGTFFTQAGDAVFDAGSTATPISGGTPPFMGTFLPEDTANFNALYGNAANGDWTLAVFDDVGGDMGFLISWSLTFVGSDPEIDVQRPVSTSIPDGSTDTVTGTVATTLVQLTYTIENTGPAVLNLTGTPIVAISGQTNCSATVSTPPGATIATSATDTFVVNLTPAATGAWSFDISIANNDTDENPYDFTVSGTATAVPMAEIDVQRPAATSIVDGGTDTVFGTVNAVLSTVTWTIANLGSATLNLTGSPIVAISGETGCTAVVSPQPGATIAASATDTFDIAITPSVTGVWSFNITIDNDDSDENPYNIAVTGTAQASAAPEIDLLRNSSSIASGSVLPFENNLGAVPFNLIFNIQNQGAATLNLTGSPLVATLNLTNCTVALTVPPTSSVIPAAGSDGFVLRVTPLAPGAFRFDVSIDNDDTDENPYTFTFRGRTGAAPAGDDDDDSGCASAPSRGGWMALLAALGLLGLARRVRARE